jgi:Flp pilus assembly protein TadB
MSAARAEVVDLDRDRIIRLEERVKVLEENLRAHVEKDDERWNKVWGRLDSISDKLSNLDGRVGAYLVAATLLGVVVAFIAAYVFKVSA